MSLFITFLDVGRRDQPDTAGKSRTNFKVYISHW